MKGLLLITLLRVSSSYACNTEVDAIGHVPDTVQWWFVENEAWRIRTFGLDHDVHIFRVVGFPSEDALASTRRNFADITVAEVRVEIEGTEERADIAKALEAKGLVPHFDLTNRFLFWKPDDGEYNTQSRPEEGSATCT